MSPEIAQSLHTGLHQDDPTSIAAVAEFLRNTKNHQRIMTYLAETSSPSTPTPSSIPLSLQGWYREESTGFQSQAPFSAERQNKDSSAVSTPATPNPTGYFHNPLSPRSVRTQSTGNSVSPTLITATPRSFNDDQNYHRERQQTMPSSNPADLSIQSNEGNLIGITSLKIFINK